jgi:hypothetical protein
VRIGTRLTIVLLLCVMPVVAAYSYWNVAQSSIYLDELKQSARAVSVGLTPSVDQEVIANEFDKIGDAFRKMDSQGTRSAILRKDGTLWYSLPDFPIELVATARAQLAHQSAEFGPTSGAKSWFCELVPLQGPRGDVIGYLLEVQDWTKVARDIRTQSIASIVVALGLLAILVTVIPAMVHRYVSRPLADLSGKVTRFSANDPDKAAGSEVELIDEEFRRLDRQLNQARSDLEERHRRAGGRPRARNRHADGRYPRARGESAE